MDKKRIQIECMKDLLEKVKKEHELKTDRECWKLLNMSEGFYKYVKAGRKNVSNTKGLEIAAKASLPAERVLTFIQREKANSVEEKAVWNRIIKQQRRIMDIRLSNARKTNQNGKPYL